jgi:UDP-glucose 4-epimerase
MNIDNYKLSLVVGGAGFIGTNLVSGLLASGKRVAIIDNLSNGRESFLSGDPTLAKTPLVVADVSNRAACEIAFDKIEKLGEIGEVWHLAANSDIPAGVSDPDVDHKDTFLTTFEILRAMQQRSIDTLHFASSSAIYGDLGMQALHEEIGPLFPISNYGAMKLASEAQISAAAESFLKHTSIFRFPNVVGVPATHGVILDFIRKLYAQPECLEVLGDGTQQKSYLHVSDLVDAMLLISQRHHSGVMPVNIGPIDDGVTVRFIAEAVASFVEPKARIVFGKGNKGWIGDVPRFTYSIDRLQSFGWRPTLGSRDAVLRAIVEIVEQERGISEK